MGLRMSCLFIEGRFMTPDGYQRYPVRLMIEDAIILLMPIILILIGQVLVE